MIAKIHSAIPHGFVGRLVEVEGDMNRGLPAFNIVGCEARMNNFIDKANEEQQSRTKEWHDKIMAKLYNNEEQIEKDSLLAYIHNKPFIQQQNN